MYAWGTTASFDPCAVHMFHLLLPLNVHLVTKKDIDTYQDC